MESVFNYLFPTLLEEGTHFLAWIMLDWPFVGVRQALPRLEFDDFRHDSANRKQWNTFPEKNYFCVCVCLFPLICQKLPPRLWEPEVGNLLDMYVV
jgi:hypothetical protein